MPQQMNVLCCYSCEMFQVHIVKKEQKWQCKVCNEKQSIRRVYFQGSGKDCRSHVQELNLQKLSDLESAQTTHSDNDNCRGVCLCRECIVSTLKLSHRLLQHVLHNDFKFWIDHYRDDPVNEI